MNHKFTFAAGVCLALLSGCGNTADGAKLDAESNGEKSAQIAKSMSDGLSETGRNLSAATMLTPKIKLAINAEKKLNDTRNLINVDSTAEKVVLGGHVMDKSMKDLAGEIAAKVMKENHADQKLENKLDIKA